MKTKKGPGIIKVDYKKGKEKRLKNIDLIGSRQIESLTEGSSRKMHEAESKQLFEGKKVFEKVFLNQRSINFFK